MKTSIKKSLWVLCIVLISGFAYADLSGIELGVPTMGGNGCPFGSSEIFLSPDQREMFIRFTKYEAIAGSDQSSLARKTCNLAIPLHLPQGLSVSLLGIDYLGSISLPRKATAQFNSETFFAGSTGLKQSKTFTGKTSGDIHLESLIKLESQVWSKCGEDSILRINTSLLVKTNSRNQRAIASMDGAALEAGLVYKIATRECSL